LKEITQEHFGDVWKVIETGNKNYGPNWRGTGGYARVNAFTKKFAEHCRDCSSSNEVRAKLKRIVSPSIIWQGDQICCMKTKTARTLQSKICMVERKEILH
jgi:hypothetical protein